MILGTKVHNTGVKPGPKWKLNQEICAFGQLWPCLANHFTKFHQATCWLNHSWLQANHPEDPRSTWPAHRRLRLWLGRAHRMKSPAPLLQLPAGPTNSRTLAAPGRCSPPWSGFPMDAKSRSGVDCVNMGMDQKFHSYFKDKASWSPRLSLRTEKWTLCDGHADGESVDREATSGYKLVYNPLEL